MGGFDLDSDESKLRQTIMTEYAPDIRPVSNTSTVTFVNISLTNIQIMNLDEQNQVMITSAQIVLVFTYLISYIYLSNKV